MLTKGRTVTYQDRLRARALIAKVDEKIRKGLLGIGPMPFKSDYYPGWSWMSGPSSYRKRDEDASS